MRRPRRQPYELLLVALLALPGCPRPPVGRPGVAPTAAQLVDHLRRRSERLRSLRFEAKVDYLAERGDRIKLTMTFLVARPASLRIDAESPLGGPLMSLASDGQRFQLLDGRQNRYLSGPASPCAIGQLLRVRLAPGDLLDVLTGQAPLLGAPTAVAWDPEGGGRELLTLEGDGVRQTLWLAPKTFDLLAAEVRTRGGAVLYRLRHDDFVDVGGERLPERTTIEDPGARSDARLRVRSRELGPELPKDAFTLTPPPGLPAESLGCDEPAAP